MTENQTIRVNPPNDGFHRLLKTQHGWQCSACNWAVGEMVSRYAIDQWLSDARHKEGGIP